ncbi:hypothetical protein [Rossellomorea vietnamensis]
MEKSLETVKEASDVLARYIKCGKSIDDVPRRASGVNQKGKLRR